MSEFVHISYSRVDQWKILRTVCPECGVRARQLATFQEWYGWTITCLACGDRWQDGELCPRPFKPRWRHENVANAEAHLKRLRKTDRERSLLAKET